MSDEPQPGGLEFFLWKGQKRWKCPLKWEGGAACSFDSYDLGAMRDHMTIPHTQDGKPSERTEVSPLFDHEGKQIVKTVFKDRPVPPDERKVKFKP